MRKDWPVKGQAIAFRGLSGSQDHDGRRGLGGRTTKGDRLPLHAAVLPSGLPDIVGVSGLGHFGAHYWAASQIRARM